MPAWQTAVQYYDQAAQQYPDLWRKDGPANEAKRIELTKKLADYYMDQARQTEDPAQVIRALSPQNLYYQSHNPTALNMLSAPLAYQRGLMALSTNEYQTAYLEFNQVASKGDPTVPSEVATAPASYMS